MAPVPWGLRATWRQGQPSTGWPWTRVSKESTHFPEAELPDQHPPTPGLGPPCWAMEMLGQQESQALPWPAGLDGGSPLPVRVPNTGNLFAANGRLPRCCRSCRRTRALSCWPCHPRVWSRAASTEQSQRGAQPQGPPPSRQHFPPLVYLQALARGVPRSPDSEHPLTHSISMASHRGHHSCLPAPALWGAAGDRGEQRGGCQDHGTWAA